MQNCHRICNLNQIPPPMPDYPCKYPDICSDPIQERRNFSNLRQNQDTISDCSRVSQIRDDMQHNFEQNFANNNCSWNCCQKPMPTSRHVSFENKHDACARDANYFRHDLGGASGCNHLSAINEENHFCPHGRPMYGGVRPRKMNCNQDEYARPTSDYGGCAGFGKGNWQVIWCCIYTKHILLHPSYFVLGRRSIHARVLAVVYLKPIPQSNRDALHATSCTTAQTTMLFGKKHNLTMPLEMQVSSKLRKLRVMLAYQNAGNQVLWSRHVTCIFFVTTTAQMNSASTTGLNLIKHFVLVRADSSVVQIQSKKV